MIHIDNLDGDGTIFISTDDGTQSIGQVDEEYVDIMQDVFKAYNDSIVGIDFLEFLEWAEETHPAYLNNLKQAYKKHKEEIK